TWAGGPAASTPVVRRPLALQMLNDDAGLVFPGDSYVDPFLDRPRHSESRSRDQAYAPSKLPSAGQTLKNVPRMRLLRRRLKIERQFAMVRAKDMGAQFGSIRCKQLNALPPPRHRNVTLLSTR